MDDFKNIDDDWGDREYMNDLVPDTDPRSGRQALREKGDPRRVEVETPLPEDLAGWRKKV